MHLSPHPLLLYALTLLPSLLPLAHAKVADPSVSLQWALCDASPGIVLDKLSIPSQAPYKSNPVVYFDSWPPSYTQSGMAFRTKVKKHDPGYPISMIKARFGEFTEDVPTEASCVWDRYGNETTYTCGLSSILSDVGGAEGEGLWSQEQREFVERYREVQWADLVPFGPYQNPKWKTKVLGIKAVFDDVQAAPLHLMEIELSAKQSESVQVYDDVTRLLQEKGIVLCEQQLPKTERLLQYLQSEAKVASCDSLEARQVVLH